MSIIFRREWNLGWKVIAQLAALCGAVACGGGGGPPEPEPEPEPEPPVSEAGCVPGRRPATAPPDVVPLQAIVRFRKADKEITAADLEGVKSIAPTSMGLHMVAFTDGEATTAEAKVARTLDLIRALRARPDVEYAQADLVFSLSAVPNDPLYPMQTNYPQISLPAAWDLTTGSPDIRIAVLDTGSTRHPELIRRSLPGLEYDAVLQDGSAETPQGATYRHGVHVAGIVGGASNNGAGGAGVCWDCTLVHVDVADPSRGGAPTSSSIIRGINWAVRNNIHVINLSLAANVPCTSPAVDDFNVPALKDAIERAIRAGITVVAAAGNSAVDTSFVTPASCPGVIAVGAATRASTPTAYSNCGSDVDVYAPGGDTIGPGGGTGEVQGDDIGCQPDPASGFSTHTDGIISTWTTTDVDNNTANDHCHRYLAGTSMSAPHVTGVVGLMLSRNPTLTPAQTRDIIARTARSMTCPTPCSAGLLDAAEAVRQAATLPVNDTPPIAWPMASCAGLYCTLSATASSDDKGIVSYQWTFPNNVTRTGTVVTQMMPGYRPHTVQLRVTDTAGQSHWRAISVMPFWTDALPGVNSGVWHNPDRPGPWIEIYDVPGVGLVVGWFAFRPDGGRPVWYHSQVVAYNDQRWFAGLYHHTWNGRTWPVTQTQVGSIRIDFHSAREATFSWDITTEHGGVVGRGSERIVYVRGTGSRGGAWYNTAESGWGVQLQDTSTESQASLGIYHPHGDKMEAIFLKSRLATPGDDVTYTLDYLVGPGLCPTCGGVDPPVPDPLWQGTMRLRIGAGADVGSASVDVRRMTSIGTFPVWQRSPFTLTRLTH